MEKSVTVLDFQKKKDLGEKTTDIAVAMVEYNPGDGWNPGYSSLQAGCYSFC